ncbi:MAG TPA: sulfite reductase, partial [Polyangia bacterium]
MSDDVRPAPGSSENETIKDTSNYLRGTIAKGLSDPITGGIAPSDQQLLKFHGMYQQDDRDVRLERQRQKLEPLHSFLIRIRMPGGVCTPAQYLELDRLACAHAG